MQFLDKPNGNGAPVAAEPAMAPANGGAAQTAEVPAAAADIDDLPF